MSRMYGITGNRMNDIPAVAVVDTRADVRVFETLSSRGLKIVRMPPYPGMGNEIASHPGIKTLQKAFPGSKIENIRIKE